MEKGYRLNVDAYERIIQIEVAIREFFIQLIKDNSVEDWFNDFLSGLQRDSIKEVASRVVEAQKNNNEAEIQDQFIYTLSRAIKELNSKGGKVIRHPFYYLNWNDLSRILAMKKNNELLGKNIGIENKDRIIYSLNNINPFRNDVAHSRYLRENEYNIIDIAYQQIKNDLPDFDILTEKQSSEHAPNVLKNKVMESIELINIEKCLNSEQIKNIENCYHDCLNSFWFRTFDMSLVNRVDELQEILCDYKKESQKQGSIMYIMKWKKKYGDKLRQIGNEF